MIIDHGHRVRLDRSHGVVEDDSYRSPSSRDEGRSVGRCGGAGTERGGGVGPKGGHRPRWFESRCVVLEIKRVSVGVTRLNHFVGVTSNHPIRFKS